MVSSRQIDETDNNKLLTEFYSVNKTFFLFLATENELKSQNEIDVMILARTLFCCNGFYCIFIRRRARAHAHATLFFLRFK